MKKLVIAYRDNELFSKYVPKILKYLPENIVVEQYIYPLGTSDDYIEIDLSAKLQVIRSRFIYLSDQTCNRIYSKIKNNNMISENLETFDYAFFQETIRALAAYPDERKDNEWIHYNELMDTEAFNQVLKRLCKMITGNKEVKEIIVITDRINDHANFINGDMYSTDTYMIKLLKIIFPSSTAHLLKNKEEVSREMLNSRNLLVFDRHISGWEQWVHEIPMLILPIETTCYQLIKSGEIMMDFDPKWLYKILFKWVKLND